MNVRSINDTHDPSLRSWVATANEPGCDFPLQNLPFGIFRTAGTDEAPRGGVAIGDAILDLGALHEDGLFWGDAADALEYTSRPTLNAFMELGHDASHALRAGLSRALREDSPVRAKLEPMLVPQAKAEMLLPARIGDYTDFYSSIYHATAVGELFRPDMPLFPNYRWLPVGYHGRASSLVVSGTRIAWPAGQRAPRDGGEPAFGPSQRMDYEAELGIYVGRGNALGSPIAIADADDATFGVCVLNDWSARDIQGWEYQPLGPFLGKSFATTLSPWVVTLEALAPYRVPLRRPAGYEATLAYLAAPEMSAFDIEITASVTPRGAAPALMSTASWADAFWTAAQMIAHHTVNGCNLRPGDVLGTGTLSGPQPAQAGCLLELSSGGKAPLAALGGRAFLIPDDTVTLTARASSIGFATIGLGSASGTIR